MEKSISANGVFYIVIREGFLRKIIKNGCYMFEKVR